MQLRSVSYTHLDVYKRQTSTTVYLGTEGNILEEKAENCKQLRINDPILTNTDPVSYTHLDVYKRQ